MWGASLSAIKPKALITGCAGLSLSPDEIAFFKAEKPFGLILFKRNCANPAQLTALVKSFRDAVGDADAPVFIDQEGGRVARLPSPPWPKFPAAAIFGEQAKTDPAAAIAAARAHGRALADALIACGVTVNCAPLLDLPQPGADNIIGDRALSPDPALTARLGRALSEGLLAGGVLPVIKHIPGHGRALVDSHKALPRVTTDAATLSAHDFAPFKALADAPIGMTAHIVFDAYDPKRPATQSPTVVAKVIRGEIGFKGLLLSDDISMNALSGDIVTRGKASLAAGCDIVLHCNGDLAEMKALAAALPPVSPEAEKRWSAAAALRRTLGKGWGKPPGPSI